MFSKPEKEIAVQSEWQNFVHDGQLTSSQIRKIINDSWIRSRHAGVSINALDAPVILQSQELEEYVFKHKQLLQSSLQILKPYQSLLDYHDLLLIISDAKGVILHTLGDMRIYHKAESMHLISGANWSEQTCGTNAIGTALETGCAVQVHANEHYCTTAKHWTCTANIIRNPLNKEVLGVLDVSGLKASYNAQTLALVTSLAAQIEKQLYIQEIEKQNILLDKFMAFQQYNHCASILFDHHGQAIQANALMKELVLKNSPFDEFKIKHIFKNLNIRHIDDFFMLNELYVELHYEQIVHKNNIIGQIVYCTFKTFTTANPQIKQHNSDPHIIGQSQILMNTLNKTRQLARTSIPILLNGETGVGKELFAQFIHQNSLLHHQPFVIINCGSFSKELISAELFGYVDGAFTGARKGGMKGKIEAADGGTLFLDEIGELPLELQTHLLRTLESGEIYRLGENKPRKINFRLISATNRNLKEEVENKNFRLDLLHRIAVSQINIPSLKERQEDIELLLDYHLEQFIKKHKLNQIQFTKAAKSILKAYSWPGNIRELRNIVEVMAVTCKNNIIDYTCIPEDFLNTQTRYKNQFKPLEFCNHIEQPNPKVLQDIEYDLIKQTLLDCNGNVTKVAKALGLAKSTMYLKIKKYKLNDLISELRESKLN